MFWTVLFPLAMDTLNMCMVFSCQAKMASTLERSVRNLVLSEGHGSSSTHTHTHTRIVLKQPKMCSDLNLPENLKTVSRQCWNLEELKHKKIRPNWQYSSVESLSVALNTGLLLVCLCRRILSVLGKMPFCFLGGRNNYVHQK